MQFKPMKAGNCDLSLILENVTYNPDTGKFFWARTARGRSFPGEVGNRDMEGYLRANICGKSYKMHRLAFLFMTGSLPPSGLVVDHINGVPWDNKWSNLRLCTTSENAHNAKIACTNTTGVKGLSKCKGDYKNSPHYKARVSIEGIRYEKRLHFTPETEAEVILELTNWLRVARRILHQDFANHGDNNV